MSSTDRPATTCRASRDGGFSLIEILAVTFVLVTLAGLATIMFGNMVGHYRVSGDARGVSNMVAVGKLRAASLFTQTRMYVDLNSRAYHVEVWQKTGTPGWVDEGATTTLSAGVTFGFGAVATPPPNTQATIAQAAACLNDAGVAIANTACVIFNSRGLPVDASGTPTGIGAFYLTDGTAVYAATVSATGMLRFWRTPAGVTPNWALQ